MSVVRIVSQRVSVSLGERLWPTAPGAADSVDTADTADTRHGGAQKVGEW